MELVKSVVLSEKDTWDEIAILYPFAECHKFVLADGVFGNWSTRSLDYLEKGQRLQTVAARILSQLESIGQVTDRVLLDETVADI
jgi:hypothetical protein